MNRFIDQTKTFSSPAKLNLFLHIVGRRSDGYHELETLFQFLDHSDTLSFTVTANEQIQLSTPITGVNNDDNLIVKAARLLQQRIRQDQHAPILGVNMSIDKILPMGGGLGGGSSNAATVLLALNTLWQANYSITELANLGLKLGADVPIFIHGHAAFAQGVGEKFTPASPEEAWYLVSKPNVSISTQSVFTSNDLPRNTEKVKKPDHLVNIMNDDFFHNDCQTMVIKHYSEVAKLLAWLIEYAPSRMTGTGACVFSRFTSQEQACEVQAKLPKGITSFVAKGLNKSPLITQIASL